MKKENPQISVIVPVYNVEKYLPRCIESILAQTFTDFELLLIDDGSPDNCGQICDKYSEEDERIKVFHKKNGGVSSARNMGLDNAKGEWGLFVDSDDWVEDEFLKAFALTLSSYDYDIVFQNHIIEKKESIINPIKKQIVQNSDCSDAILYLIKEERFGYTWNKIFKRERIENLKLRFREDMSLWEDELFTLMYCAGIKSMCSLPEAYYHYRIGENTLTSIYRKPKEMIRIAQILYNQAVITFDSADFIMHEHLRYLDSIYYAFTNAYHNSSPRDLRREVAEIIFNEYKHNSSVVRKLKWKSGVFKFIIISIISIRKFFFVDIIMRIGFAIMNLKSIRKDK